MSHTAADLLGCVGADLIDVARRVEVLPRDLTVAAAMVELSSITTARDGPTVEVTWLLARVAEHLAMRPQSR